MKLKRLVTKTAMREIAAINDYLLSSLKSPQAAANFRTELKHQMNLICESPELFHISRIPELALFNFRSVMVNNYVMVFLVTDDSVVVEHIFHSKQDYGKCI